MYILTLAVRTSMMQLYAVGTLFQLPSRFFSDVPSFMAELAPQTHNPDKMVRVCSKQQFRSLIV